MYYFDNAATTRSYDEVAEIMNKYLLEEYYNPSALYKKGLDIEKDINAARQTIADELKVEAGEIYFTPGATWSNNIVIQSILSANKGANIVTSQLEHSSVYEPIRSYAGHRKIIYLANDCHGKIDIGELEKASREDTALVSIMHVNNELGTIEDIELIGSILKEKDIPFHVDGVQGFCKYDIDLKKSNVDFYSLSSHKIHGPKGIGALYVSKDASIKPLNLGGGQERGLVPGTENVPGIMGLAKAVDISSQDKEKSFKKVKEMYDYLRHGLASIDDCIINSPLDGSVYIINAAFKDIKSEVLIHMMSDHGFCISAGSACGKNKKSRIGQAIKLGEDYSQGPIRISLSHLNTMEECEKLLDSLKANIGLLRQIMRR